MNSMMRIASFLLMDIFLWENKNREDRLSSLHRDSKLELCTLEVDDNFLYLKTI